MLVAITLANNAAAVIEDALRSAPWCDLYLVVDSVNPGEQHDRTLDIARSIVGDRLRVVERSTDTFLADPEWFCSQRNFGLDEAAKLGDWALILDTDERMRLTFDPRPILANTKEDQVQVRFENALGYPKVRFIRLPAASRFVGQAHEVYLPHGDMAEWQGAYFDELPKPDGRTTEQNEELLRRLLDDCEKSPDSPRWPFLAGQTLQALGRWPEAIDQYRRCYLMDGWGEEAAVAAYHAAECYAAMGNLLAAVEMCAGGLVRHPGVVELPWFAACCELAMGRPAKAVPWAHMAIALGRVNGCGLTTRRLQPCTPAAHYAGPFEVLEQAYRQMGYTRLADGAERATEAARRKEQADLGTTTENGV